MAEYALLKWMVQIYFWLVFNQQKPFNPRALGSIGVVEKDGKFNFHEY
jgi:hypothetical protein